MGRPAKYKTEEERAEGQRAVRRAYYYRSAMYSAGHTTLMLFPRNLTTEREQARVRWHRRAQTGPTCASVRAIAPRVLAATVAVRSTLSLAVYA